MNMYYFYWIVEFLLLTEKGKKFIDLSCGKASTIEEFALLLVNAIALKTEEKISFFITLYDNDT